MRRAWWLLTLAVLATAAVLPRWRRDARAPSSAPAPSAAPIDTLVLRLVGGSLVPAVAQVGLGHDVYVRIAQAGDDSVRVGLSGYEHAVGTFVIAPRAEWQGRFRADLPGDDFAWLVQGRPVGKLRVSGSHLVEGHR